MKKYSIIYADPPWNVKAGPGFNPNGISRNLQYPTMILKEISELPVKHISEKDAHLYLWTINKYVYEAYDIARCWGFKPITMITWCKKPMGLGLGGAFVQTTEHLLFCRRGKLPIKERIDSTWFLHKRTKPHSKKPDIVRDMIIKVSGDLPRIELFARNKIDGWDCFGNEVESNIVLNTIQEAT